MKLKKKKESNAEALVLIGFNFCSLNAKYEAYYNLDGWCF